MTADALNIKASEFAEEFLSVEGLVFNFGKLCLIAAVGFAYETGLTLHKAEQQKFSPAPIADVQDQGDEKSKVSLDSYNIIASRNIFGAKARAKARPAPVAKTSTTLKLRLVGTNVGKESSFAIIENSKNKEQELFDLSQRVFGQGKLIEIKAESVKIDFGGEIHKLVLEEGSSSSGPESNIETSEDGTEFVIAEKEVEDALANLPKLLSQARAVPYFKNGESIGMRLFAIRRGSLYERLGLKNGDILKAVNDNSLSDPTQALKIFEQLKSERSISVEIERAGSEKSLSYEIR